MISIGTHMASIIGGSLLRLTLFLLLENVGLKSLSLIPLNKNLRYLEEFSLMNNEKKANILLESLFFSHSSEKNPLN